MAIDYLPTRDPALGLWTANFSTLITATPTASGLTALQASSYATLDAIWQSALAAATDPGTRTKATVAAKDAGKANVKAASRSLAIVVQSFPGITSDQIA